MSEHFQMQSVAYRPVVLGISTHWTLAAAFEGFYWMITIIEIYPVVLRKHSLKIWLMSRSAYDKFSGKKKDQLART